MNILQKTSKAFMISICLFLAAVVLSSGFETSSSNHDFEFTITSGKNNEIGSSNYETFAVVGGITGSSASSNYNNRVGFLITNPFINGEACSIDAECYSNICCSGMCASSCPTGGGGGGGAGGGGSGGGGGGYSNASYADYENGTLIHFYNSVTAGNRYNWRISVNWLAVINVSFIAKENLQNVNLRVFIARNIDEPAQDVFQYFEIQSDKLKTNNIEEMRILFRIPKENNYDPDQIGISRYEEGVWGPLSTIRVGEDSKYYYFESITYDMGLFAITTRIESRPEERPPLEEATGKVIEEPKKPVETAPPVLDERSPVQKTGWLVRIASLLGMVLLLIIVVMGLFAYRFAQLEEERRIKYLEFSAVIKDINRYMEQNNLQVAVALYKKLIGDYVNLMQSEFVALGAKDQIHADFRSVYEDLNAKVKDIHYIIPEEYWRR